MPDPAVPPTPPVPLAALLAREDLALRQIAGPTDPDIVIHWAHTSEMADPYPYLLGGELLLTAGVHIQDAAGSGTYFDDYVSRIVAAGGAALGFGVAPVHDTVPRALVAACEAYELPLVEVPPQTTFSGVARAVWQLMAQARLAELRRVTEAQQSLAAAASRPDPVPSVLRQLAQRVGGRAVLYGPDGGEIAEAGRGPGAEVKEALADLAGVVRPTSATRQPTEPGATGTTRQPAGPDATGKARQPAGPGATGTARRPTEPSATNTTRQPAGPGPTGTARRPTEPGATGTTRQPAGPGPTGTARQPREPGAPGSPVPTERPPASRPSPTSATDTVAGTHLAAYALGSGQGFVLGIAAPQRDPGDHTIASVAAVLLTLLTGEHHSGAGAARSSALVRLLLGSPPEDVAPLLSRSGEVGCGLAAPRRGAGNCATSHDGAAADRRHISALPAKRPGGDRWLVVHARPDAHTPDAVAASALGAALGSPLVDLAGDVVRVLVPVREIAPQPGWTLGVSAAVAPQEWPAADTQAARALARARATRTALIRHGAHRSLTELFPQDEAEAHARTLLAPVAATPALTETLHTWLSLHGSWDRTAVALSVHRNTVRQRIARCAALLDADLDDPDVRMELWFALRKR